MEVLTCLFQASLLVFVIGNVQSQNLFTNADVKNGDQTTLTCHMRNAGATVTEFPTVNGVVGLTVHRDGGDPIVVYSFSVISFTVTDTTTLDTLNYTVTTEGIRPDGQTVAGNEDLMKITILFKSVTCTDEAVYTCKAFFYDQTDQLINREATQNLTVSAAPRLDSSFAVPDTPAEIGYERNDKVTYTCRAYGPQTMEIQWHYRRCPDENDLNPAMATDFQRWNTTNDIILTGPTPRTALDGCSEYELESKLNAIQLNAVGALSNQQLCDVKCILGLPEGGIPFVEIESWNASIGYKDATGNVQSQNLFTNADVKNGDQTTLTCHMRNAGATVTDFLTVNGVLGLTVHKDGGDPIVEYSFSASSLTVTDTTSLDTSNYTVTTEGIRPNGQTVAGNENDMKVTILFKAVTCTDEAVYTCKAFFFDQNDQLTDREATQNLTISEGCPQENGGVSLMMTTGGGRFLILQLLFLLCLPVIDLV